MKRREGEMTRKKQLSVLLIAAIGVAALLTGCSDSDKTADGKTIVELVHYKPEAVDVFEQLEAEFNATHDDVQLKIESPNDAMTILKTGLPGRIIRISSVSAEISITPTLLTQIF